MPFCLQSCCDACKFFLTYFPLEKKEKASFFSLWLIQGNIYLWEFPRRTKKAELEGQKPHLQHWRETESPLALPCCAAGALFQLVHGLFQPLGSAQMNHNPEFIRFLSHTTPLCPVASHKHLLGLQRSLWSFCREYATYISLRIPAMALMLLWGAWNASGIRPQVSSDNGTQILKRNEKPKLCKSTAPSNWQLPFPSPVGSCRFPVWRWGGADLIRGGCHAAVSVFVGGSSDRCFRSCRATHGSHGPQVPACCFPADVLLNDSVPAWFICCWGSYTTNILTYLIVPQIEPKQAPRWFYYTI